MAALLIAGWTTVGDPVADLRGVPRMARRRSLCRCWASVFSGWRSSRSLPNPQGRWSWMTGTRPRFTAPPTRPEDLSTRSITGRGERSIELAGNTPLLVEFDSSTPISLRSADQDLIQSGRARRGVALFDPASGRTLDVSAAGAWRLLVRPVSSAIFWEALSPLDGQGPNVLVFPGGLVTPVEVAWSSDDPRDRVRFVGGCRLGTCGELPRNNGVIPAGTEALVVDAAGSWEIVPGLPAEGQQPPLRGTDLSG